MSENVVLTWREPGVSASWMRIVACPAGDQYTLLLQRSRKGRDWRTVETWEARDQPHTIVDVLPHELDPPLSEDGEEVSVT